jgi:hypothetical protein
MNFIRSLFGRESDRSVNDGIQEITIEIISPFRKRNAKEKAKELEATLNEFEVNFRSQVLTL